MIEEADNSAQQSPAGPVRGAVMVVGAGITGMQSALDLAEAGFKVYLVEKTTSIGGRMAQLDKTFPTNDCAMCTISPRLIDVARHDNIEIVTGAELTELGGEAGDFTAHLNIQPRFIDMEKCNACGECMQVCPVRVPAEFEAGAGERPAIHRRFPQAIPGEFAISKEGVSPCRIECPAGCNAHAYIALIGRERYDRAIAIIRETLPLPGVMGRVCDHACEGECHRGKIDQAMAIRNLKRFAADWEAEHAEIGEHGLPLLDAEGREAVAEVEKKPQRVAIVGSGPAGMTAARDLILEGYGVTVFEAQEKAGGMLRYGIPRYRLEAEVIDRDVQSIVDLGVELRCSSRVDDPAGLLADEAEEKFDAVFAAVGAWTSRRLGIEGEDAYGVRPGLKFLHEVNSGDRPKLGETVLVIGGGDVAMDAARCARRMPGVREVHLACLESRDEMPAHKWEAQEALEEGVVFHNSLGPTRFVVEGGKVTATAFRACTRVFDDDGRFSPEFDDSQTSTIAADTVIVTIGQGIDPGSLGSLDAGRGGRIAVDEVTLAASIEGVFAGGDAVLGPASAVKAIAQGHRAAESIIRYLRFDDLSFGRLVPTRDEAPEPDRAVERRPRRPMPTIDLDQRLASFDVLETGYGEADALAEASRCLNCSTCCECMECVRACSPAGVIHDMTASGRDLSVGAVILSAGYELFDAAAAGWYLCGEAPNVVTNLQFERMCSSSGPTGGDLRRPSDGKRPKRVAWIQCVGSRDVTCGRDYCSGFCCMASIKEATMTRDHYDDCETTVFYNDIRAYGKGFEKYYTRARDVHGVEFVKSLPARVTEHTQTGSLDVHFSSEDGQLLSREFDLIVLGTGMEIDASARRLAEVAGVEADKFGFFHDLSTRPGQTARKGVFVAGALEGPKDIPESVVGGSAAAALAMELLSGGRGTEVTVKQYPPEREVAGEEPRIGVFVCRCGTNIARVVDVETLSTYAATLPHVVHAEENLYTCSTDTQAKIVDTIREKDLNRVIVTSCTPRTHEALFRETLRQAGLNPYLFEMANIRDQCSWVHEPWPDRANDKAKALLRMAVHRSAELESIPERSAEVIHAALVVGGGPAGMTAALNLAGQGFGVTLIEREDRLGGQLYRLYRTLDGVNVPALRDELIRRVEANPHINLMLETEAVSCEGHIGHYTTVVRSADGAEQTLEHAVGIFATGGQEYEGDDFGLGGHDRVCSQRQLEADLVEGRDVGENIVMIQCVGSRNEEHGYCSRICCSTAVKNALAIKKANPAANVHVLHRGVRTYGLTELAYREAREAGVIFVRFDEDKPPDVDLSGERPVVKLKDPAVDHTFELAADRLVLSTGIVADPSVDRLCRAFKVPSDEDGFLLEAHIKLRPVDFTSDGLYLCGLAHAPKSLGESIGQALAASARAAAVLSKERLPLSGYVAEVDPERCAACMTCARICPYGVPRLDEEKRAVVIDPAACHGCGSCAAQCPGRAIEVGHFKPRQMLAKLEGLAEEGSAK